MPKTTETVPGSHDDIHWKQLWSLAALYGSVIIGWIAYQNYQPRLLVQFQFTDFTFLLMAAQGVILVITPLIAGRFGDRYRVEKGHRLPVISSGISLAAMIFMAVAFTLLGNPGEIFRWVLPGLIVLWLIAMSIFTSPALSTMELFTPVDRLPHAMAILTITSSLIYSLEPVIVDIIDYLGAPVTFIVGGVAVFLSGYALKKNSLGLFKQSGNREAMGPEGQLIRSPYAFIFFMGLSVGIATTILFYLLPLLLAGKTESLLADGKMVTLESLFLFDGKIVTVGILLLSAILSWPMSKIIGRYGMERIFWVSFTAIALITLAIALLSSPMLLLPLLVVFSAAFTSLSVASLPLAISRSAFSEKVFCVGIFFSGVALPEGVWEAMQAYS